MSAQPSLFLEPLEVRIAKLDAVILSLILGHPGGQFGEPLDPDERDVLRRIRFARGLAAAVPIREIQAATKLEPRAIKQCVRNLRMIYRLPVGSTKLGAGGYYLMVSAEDRKAWASTVVDQIMAELAVLHCTLGHQDALEALGQLRLDSSPEAEKETYEQSA